MCLLSTIGVTFLQRLTFFFFFALGQRDRLRTQEFSDGRYLIQPPNPVLESLLWQSWQMAIHLLVYFQCRGAHYLLRQLINSFLFELKSACNFYPPVLVVKQIGKILSV